MYICIYISSPALFCVRNTVMYMYISSPALSFLREEHSHACCLSSMRVQSRPNITVSSHTCEIYIAQFSGGAVCNNILVHGRSTS